MEECIFCKIVKGELESKIIFRGENFLVINDANPVAEGHCLVISKKHFKNIFEVPYVYGKELIKVIKEQGKRLVKEGLADGIKIVNNNGDASGQAIKHFHVHIIPEKKDFIRKNRV